MYVYETCPITQEDEKKLHETLKRKHTRMKLDQTKRFRIFLIVV